MTKERQRLKWERLIRLLNEKDEALPIVLKDTLIGSTLTIKEPMSTT